MVVGPKRTLKRVTLFFEKCYKTKKSVTKPKKVLQTQKSVTNSKKCYKLKKVLQTQKSVTNSKSNLFKMNKLF
jgi:hypothetical protein